MCQNIENDVGGNSVRDELLSKYDSMQVDEGRKTLTRYDSAFSASWFLFCL